MAKAARRDEPIQALLKEDRKFLPPKAFKARALVKSESVYREAAKNPVRFWEQRARELAWIKPWKKALEWKPPYAKWFVGGKLNVSANCLDRHVQGPHRTKAALIWEGEPGDTRTLTYWDLYREVQRFAAALKRHGVKKGDRITIYMPMVPEVAIAMLACARIGAAHSVIFGGFSPESVRDRIHDADSALVITADGGYRRGSTVPLKKNTDEALKECPGVTTVIVLKRTGEPVNMQHGRDIWWDEFVKGVEPKCPAEPMDSEDLRYLLYTSGSTGKPKGIIHTTGGYLTGMAATHKWVFDLHDDDVYWCTADVGWVTGHSYVVYGPLANGATSVMYEGTPDFPDKDRFWRIVEKYGVTICYPAPTATRTFMKWGEEFPQRCDLSSRRPASKDGYFWLLGRVDDVMNASGHRVSTMEVESALVDHKSVAEAAVIGKMHDIKGQAIAAFVTIKNGVQMTPGLQDELKQHVAKKIGALARPDDVIFSAELPKTRSGKIMRRLLRDIAEGRALGDTTTLADPNVVAMLKEKYESEES